MKIDVGVKGGRLCRENSLPVGLRKGRTLLQVLVTKEASTGRVRHILISCVEHRGRFLAL